MAPVALGFGSYEVVNLFALRATDPRKLAEANDPIGPDNHETIADAIARCDTVICAWGEHPMAASRSEYVRLQISANPGRLASCFGKTKLGAPLPPLYLRTGTKLVSYP
jgi:hypothetical protein